MSTIIFNGRKSCMATIHYPIIKEQQKYILSLATGTLIFSVTFVGKIALVPVHKWLIVTGWIFLLISIVAGITAMHSLYQLIVTMESLKRLTKDKNIPNMIFDEGYWERQSIKPFLRDDWVKDFMEKKGVPIHENEIEKYKDELLKDKTFFDAVKKQVLTPDDESIDMKKGAKMRKAVFKLFKTFQYLLRFTHPTKLMNRFRRFMIQAAILPSLTLWSFYAGVFMITIFSIMNFAAF